MNVPVRLLFLALLVAGCDRPPARVEVPRLRPDSVAAAAIKQCDANGDGSIDLQEADAAPGLKAGWKRLDRDSDGKVSADEITARIQSWLDARLGALGYCCSVQFQGKPVAGATVTLEPEPFLGSLLPSASGVSDEWGFVTPMPATSDPLGMPVGYYRVRVSKLQDNREQLPARFNRETTLGVEIAGDVEGVTTPSFPLVLE